MRVWDSTVADLWSPNANGGSKKLSWHWFCAVSDIRKLDDVQRLFTSRVADCQGMSYWERLKALNLQSLQRRRERYVIIHTWKILNDLANNDIGISFTDTENETRSGVTATVPSVPRGVPAKVISIYEQSFSVKAPKLWNCLDLNLLKVLTPLTLSRVCSESS